MPNHLVKEHLKRIQDLVFALDRTVEDAIAAWDAEDDARLDLELERSVAQARVRELNAQRRAENTDGAA